MLWLLGAPLALGGERDPLPSLAVERPLATPRGWLQVRLDQRDGARSTVDLRYGVLPRLELGLAATADWAQLRLDPVLRLRGTLLRTEPPNRSVVADLELRPPTALRDQPLVGTIALAAAQQLGPFLVSARVGRSWPDGWPIDGQVLLQVGPLAPFGSVRVRRDPWLGGGLEVQISRGLEVHGELTRDLTDAETTSRIGVGMAF